MSAKVRPWNRPDWRVYEAEPISTIEHDRETRKAVNTATGEFIKMFPGARGGDGYFFYGTLADGATTLAEGAAIEGVYNSNWYPDERVEVLFIIALRPFLNKEKWLTRSEFDAAPIARMMWAEAMAQKATDPVFAARFAQQPPTRRIVVDERPERGEHKPRFYHT